MTELLEPLEDDGGADVLGLLGTTDDISAFLDGITRLAVERSPAASCGISVQRDGLGVTVAATDELAAHADALQYRGDQGPCLQSLRSGEVVAVPDMAAEQRWSPFPEQAAAAGVGSSLSVPLAMGADGRGALNLYARSAHAFDAGDADRARQWAAQATTGLAVAARLARSEETARQLADGMESRSVISRAVGLIMGRRQMGADAAFEVLRTTSQQTNTKVRDLAARYLEEFEAELGR